MGLDVAGIYSDVSIAGVMAPGHATAVHGNLTLHGGVSAVSLESLEGRITVESDFRLALQRLIAASEPGETVYVLPTYTAMLARSL